MRLCQPHEANFWNVHTLLQKKVDDNTFFYHLLLFPLTLQRTQKESGEDYMSDNTDEEDYEIYIQMHGSTYFVGLRPITAFQEDQQNKKI